MFRSISFLVQGFPFPNQPLQHFFSRNVALLQYFCDTPSRFVQFQPLRHNDDHVSEGDQGNGLTFFEMLHLAYFLGNGQLSPGLDLGFIRLSCLHTLLLSPSPDLKAIEVISDFRISEI